MKELIYAFLIGGGLCVIAQILIDKTKLTPARILVSYVVAGYLASFGGVVAGLVMWAVALVLFAGAVVVLKSARKAA